MLRLACFIVLLAIASGCTDTPMSAVFGAPSEPDASGQEVITGILVTEQLLVSEDGREIALRGPRTELLVGLTGAEIRIYGNFEDLESFRYWLGEFEVLAVDGLPAVDGQLWPSADGFAIHTRDGHVVSLPELPDDLLGHVGQRVWLITRDGQCIRYGVLEMEV